MDLSLFFGVLLAFLAIFTIRYLSQKHESSHTHLKATKTENKPHIKKETVIDDESERCGDSCTCVSEETPKEKPIRVLFGTQTGTSKEWAHQLVNDLKSHGYSVVVSDLKTYDPEDLPTERCVFFVVSTYTDGTPPESCVLFHQWLTDFAVDFRVSKNVFQNMRYGVFGIGDSIYGKNFNAFGREIDKLMHKLSAHRLVPVGSGDSGTSTEISDGYKLWSAPLWNSLAKPFVASPVTVKHTPKVSDELDDDSQDEADGEPLVDVEDMGKFMKKSLTKTSRRGKAAAKSEVVEETEDVDEDDEDDDDEDDDGETPQGPPREMLTPSLRKSLTKQGYRLLGSHSGVKLCRWTKAMLRGRGGCYKHTFYGIQSYQCMEMTPSLACANKCVFCWRHHKNPVGKEWKWQVDGPEELVEAAIQNHQNMVKQLKGVPGVSKERYEEAFTVHHCALSLVGEPIIYPHINRFIQLLHQKGISSFMVTNAQFPDKIDSLDPVTQLYISIDAATKESLKKVDRPIFTDFWERFLGSIDSLKNKGQRTVFRLTLIKEWNMEEMINYAELVQRGEPSFVEIKGVTFCGSSKASSLTMKNVPFHEEVLKFSNMLIESNQFLKDNYELACEHEHSCCILIANKKFKVNGVWNTWINYPKFHELVNSGQDFTALDYMEPTPHWAVAGSEERGFDPEETRFKRTKPYQKQGC